VASCPSGALYKRDEDGIVLVDQERCRGWRYCVSGCPYKKVYFNWKTGRSEKCILCYPRVENGTPTLCAESCVGRIRHIGVLLYDADGVPQAASTKDPRGIYPAFTSLFLNANHEDVASAALSSGIPLRTLEAAQRSPVYKLAVEWKIAFPPHPEFRTLPMVWYIPPLSPLVSHGEGEEGPGIDKMRIPVKYLANLLTAGDEDPVRTALQRLVALREYMRSLRIEKRADPKILEAVQLSPAIADEMIRLLAIAKYDNRYVIPRAKKEDAGDLHKSQGVRGYGPEQE
jgi:nitrate reductase / nitrite oxidoreductase, beta subunit